MLSSWKVLVSFMGCTFILKPFFKCDSKTENFADDIGIYFMF
jgi:hypothetical protein